MCRTVAVFLMAFVNFYMSYSNSFFMRRRMKELGIGFIYDVAAYLNTLELVKSLRAKMFVPAHAAVSEDVAVLAQYNINKVLEIADKITGGVCQESLCFEAILQRLFTDYGLIRCGGGLLHYRTVLIPAP